MLIMAHIPPTLQNGIDLSSQDQSTSCDASLSSTNSGSAWMQRIYGNAFMQERLGMAQDPTDTETSQDVPPFEAEGLSYDDDGELPWSRNSEEVCTATKEVLGNISEEDIKDVRRAFPDAPPDTSIATLIQENLARNGRDDRQDKKLGEILGSDDDKSEKINDYETIGTFNGPSDELSFGAPQMNPSRALELLKDSAVGDKLDDLVGLNNVDLDSDDGKLKVLESLLQPENALAFVSANNQFTHNAWEAQTQHCDEPIDFSPDILATLYSHGTTNKKEKFLGPDEENFHCHPGASERGKMIQGLAVQLNDHFDIDSIAHPEAPKSSKAAPVSLAATDTRPRRAERPERSDPAPRPRR